MHNLFSVNSLFCISSLHLHAGWKIFVICILRIITLQKHAGATVNFRRESNGGGRFNEHILYVLEHEPSFLSHLNLLVASRYPAFFTKCPFSFIFGQRGEGRSNYLSFGIGVLFITKGENRGQ